MLLVCAVWAVVNSRWIIAVPAFYFALYALWGDRRLRNPRERDA